MQNEELEVKIKSIDDDEHRLHNLVCALCETTGMETVKDFLIEEIYKPIEKVTTLSEKEMLCSKVATIQLIHRILVTVKINNLIKEEDKPIYNAITNTFAEELIDLIVLDYTEGE